MGNTRKVVAIRGAAHTGLAAFEPKRSRLPRPLFAQGLTMLAETWRIEVNEARTVAYWCALSDLRPRDFARAVRDLLRSSKWMPTPAEIRAVAEKYAWGRWARRHERQALALHERMERERQERLDALARERATWGPATTARETVDRLLRVLAAHRPDVLERVEAWLDLEGGVTGTADDALLTLLPYSIDADLHRDLILAAGAASLPVRIETQRDRAVREGRARLRERAAALATERATWEPSPSARVTVERLLRIMEVERPYEHARVAGWIKAAAIRGTADRPLLLLPRDARPWDKRAVIQAARECGVSLTAYVPGTSAS